MHRHKAKTTKTRGFSAPIEGAKYNPAAHGNIEVTATCSCGRVRKGNINQQHVEIGPWRDPSRDDGDA